MPDRLILAYALIALLALFAGAVIWWNIYHSTPRSEARRRKRSAERNRRRDEAAEAAAAGNSK